MIEKKCLNCKNIFYVYLSGQNRKTCSRICSNEFIKKIGSLKEKNNPNYGKKWTQEKKNEQSKIVKEKMEDLEIRLKCGKANRGKKFSKERIEKMHKHRSPESYSHLHTEETKKYIGQKSKEKWTNEYKEKNRKIREDLGYWIPLEEKSDWEIYQKESNWIERMFNRCSKEEEILLSKHGVFNNRTNTKGVVRDHVFSRKSGFFNGIFPELLRHPVNCQIITHSCNVKKKSERYLDKDSITLEELFIAIKNYIGDWNEQKICLELIIEYEDGKKWGRKIK